jgi:Cft2 family RNA processing exonuclease
MRLVCLGGAGEIGANSYHLEAGGRGLLLDAGMNPKQEGPAALPRLDALPGEIDHILVTHSHLDHVGALPYVLRAHPRARLHMTFATARFAARMLRNSVNVLRRRAEAPDGPAPLYGFDAVEAVDEVVETHDPGEPFPLGGGVRATFWDAGHIPGAAGVLVEESGARARTLFYTGDTCGSSQLLVPAARYPEGPIDVLLTESTYGGNLTPDERRADVIRAFGRSVARVLGAGGVALVPVFALGRAQEILFALWTLGVKGRLPEAPLYLTGLARAVTRLYDETRRHTPRCDPLVRLGDIGFQVLEREAIDAGEPRGPAIVLASSGMMLPETASNALARRVLARERDAIFVVGYQDPDSPGFRVQHAAVGDPIDLDDGRPPVLRRCLVERHRFRAHSSRHELLAAARKMKPRRAVVVHGDPPSGRSLGDELAQGGSEVILPEPAAPIEL